MDHPISPSLEDNRINELEHSIRRLEAELTIIRKEDEDLTTTISTLKATIRTIKIDLQVSGQAQAEAEQSAAKAIEAKKTTRVLTGKIVQEKQLEIDDLRSQARNLEIQNEDLRGEVKSMGPLREVMNSFFRRIAEERAERRKHFEWLYQLEDEMGVVDDGMKILLKGYDGFKSNMQDLAFGTAIEESSALSKTAVEVTMPNAKPVLDIPTMTPPISPVKTIEHEVGNKPEEKVCSILDTPVNSVAVQGNSSTEKGSHGAITFTRAQSIKISKPDADPAVGSESYDALPSATRKAVRRRARRRERREKANV